MITLVVTDKLTIQQLDDAFLNGFLVEEVYRAQALGFETASKLLACKLKGEPKLQGRHRYLINYLCDKEISQR